MAKQHGAQHAPVTGPATLPRALGVLSIGLGVAQIAAPRWFSRAIGATGRAERPGMVRLVGAREIAAGAGLLTSRPTPFLWMRVVGDAMDLALLRRAASSGGARDDRIRAATTSALGIGAADLLTAMGTVMGQGGVLAAKPVRRSITIARPVSEVYAFWRRLEQLPLFMRHLGSVTELDERRSHWVATGPAGTRVAWDAEIIGEEPDRSISWRSLPGSRVQQEGVVRFLPAPGDRGTEVHVDLTYSPPAGPVGVALAKLAGQEPEQQVAESLRRLKQILETGQIVRSVATAGGRRIRQRPAQPLAETPPPAVQVPGGAGGMAPRTSHDGDTSRAADSGGPVPQGTHGEAVPTAAGGTR